MNNAESFNNLLKIGTNHKVEDMSDLIEIIQRIVASMYKDVVKAIVGLGNYKLTRPFAHHRCSVDVWCQKKLEDRNKYTSKNLTETKGSARSNIV